MPSNKGTCACLGCNRPTQVAVGKGYSATHCKQHIEFRRRHGSYWRKSLSASQLRPFLDKASKWLKVHDSDYRVVTAKRAIGSLLGAAGKVENAYSLSGLSASKRARVALARLREAKVSPDVILKRAIATMLCCETHGPHSNEYRDVQIAKSLHRLASGSNLSNSVWQFPTKYPRSEGRILRHMGKWVGDLADFALDGRSVTEA